MGYKLDFNLSLKGDSIYLKRVLDFKMRFNSSFKMKFNCTLKVFNRT